MDTSKYKSNKPCNLTSSILWVDLTWHKLILNNFKTLKNECLQIVEVSLTCYTCAEHLNHINKRILIHNTEIYQYENELDVVVFAVSKIFSL